MIYQADTIFDGTQWRSEALATEAGFVRDWINTDEALAREAVSSFPGCRIIPAFVDIQVYGAGGRLFAQYPDTRSLALLAKESLLGGAALCQPTVATNTEEVVYRAIDAVRAYWKAGGEGIAGLHLEGPWINPEKRGAHPEALIHAPTPGEVEALLGRGRGIIRTITIAPEVCSVEILEALQSEGITLSAGHSNIGYEGAIDAFDNKGITAVTHLYNAMSGLHHREPGLVGAAFLHPEVWAGIIPDGIHVDMNAVRIACQLMGGRLFAITDAVTETTEGVYRHVLTNNSHYTSDGVLSGSALTMNKAFNMLRLHAGVAVEEALRMCSRYPAQVIGLERFGWIGPGAAASFLVYDADWALVEVISEPGSRSPFACGAHAG